MINFDAGPNSTARPVELSPALDPIAERKIGYIAYVSNLCDGDTPMPIDAWISGMNHADWARLSATAQTEIIEFDDLFKL